MDDGALLSLAADLARRAGAVILAIRARGFETLRKRDQSPVTEADQAAEALILAGLRAAVPGIPVIAEEEMEAGAVHAGGSGVLAGRSVGWDEGVCGVAGRVHGEYRVGAGWATGVGGGGGTGLWGVVRGDRGGAGLGSGRVRGSGHIRVRVPPADGLHVLASRAYASDERLQGFLQGRRVAEVVNMGSALKIVRVAEGAGDLSIRGSGGRWSGIRRHRRRCWRRRGGGLCGHGGGGACGMASRGGRILGSFARGVRWFVRQGRRPCTPSKARSEIQSFGAAGLGVLPPAGAGQSPAGDLSA